MKRAASLNYLNKTSDDAFQVRNSLFKVLWSVLNVCSIIRNVLTFMSFLSPGSLSCLLVFRCQTRGGSNFRESRGLSSSTVDLYSGNWAAGGQVADLWADLLTDPKMLLPSSLPWSHDDHRRHYQTASALLHTLSLPVSMWPKDPFPPTFRPKDIFSHPNMYK